MANGHCQSGVFPGLCSSGTGFMGNPLIRFPKFKASIIAVIALGYGGSWQKLEPSRDQERIRSNEIS